MLGLVAAAAVLSIQGDGPGVTFGNGVPGFPVCAEPVTLVNHTLSPNASHGVLCVPCFFEKL